MIGSLGSLITGLLSKGGPSIDVAALYDTIRKAGTDQRALINALPPEIQKNLATYASSLGKAGEQYQSNIQGQGQQYLGQVKGLYDPNSLEAKAVLDAQRKSIYSTVPGTQDAIRQAMAASGGLMRGNAAVALAQPYAQAGQQYGQVAADFLGKNYQASQQAQQQALATVNSMDDAMFTNLFGMSKDQATNILSTGNQALRDQLSQLINQSVNETNQTLSVQGIQANNAYQNAVANTARQNAIIGNAVNLGLEGIQGGLASVGGLPGIAQGLGMGPANPMPTPGMV